MSSPKKQFCLNNHDTFICGRTARHRCNECVRLSYMPVIIDKRKTKFCPKGHDKDITGRDSHGKCKVCKKEHPREYARKHKRKRIRSAEEKARIAKYQKEHKNEIKAAKQLRLQNPSIRLAARLRNRINKALKGLVKPSSSIRELGCSTEFLKQYIESLWLPGMSWDNYGKGRGKWHIDHIIPLANFDLTNLEQFRQACYYTNLQPLWAEDNWSKSNKIL